jgi:transcription elongation GreA/GreB family factor/very-short-patch-repair endonuclease
VNAAEHSKRATANPEFAPRIQSAESLDAAENAVEALDALIKAAAYFDVYPWLSSVALIANSHRDAAVVPAIQALVDDAVPLFQEHKDYVRRPVSVPQAVLDSRECLAVIGKLAAGQNAFGIFAFAEKKLKPLIDDVRVIGRQPQGSEDWSHVRAYALWRNEQHQMNVRWAAVADDFGVQTDASLTIQQLAGVVGALKTAVLDAPRTRRALDGCLQKSLAQTPGFLWPSVARMTELRDCLRDAVASIRLAASRAEIARVEALFEGRGKFGPVVKNFFDAAVGNSDVPPERIEEVWSGFLKGLNDIAAHRSHILAVREFTDRIERSGAPQWAARLRTEPAAEGNDSQLPSNWADAWDWAAAQAYLRSIDKRGTMRALAEERAMLDANISKSFEKLVRERTFYALALSMTGPVRAALMMFATALRQMGTGRGVGAARHRRAARQAMSACYSGVPCWIMPSWRVAEQLPGEVGTFDLVIMDEASQSDVKEVTTLLRGKKILVVGDDKQVSPSAAFIENAKIDRLERTYLANQPFKTLLLPGSSLYDLAKVMFPDKFVMLREHFRCVEPIIQFSTQFYTEALIPLRIPTPQERLDPPLIDIYVSDGRRSGDKINRREAEVIIEEIKHIVTTPSLATRGEPDTFRTIGVISLIGAKQAGLINRLVLEELGEEIVARHKIACGDSATFQGNERDIVFLSMVADPTQKQAQTATHFEQRFNVAMSRARDRLYLVRSVREEQLNPKDLKAKVIRHMRDPMPSRVGISADAMERCDSDFEREILGQLINRGYRVTPQVGAMGFSIDMVVEGDGNQRLAIECDGDKYHGPERWADDMSRQRVLERVGWKFWRCWSSSYTVAKGECLAELFDTLDRHGIRPCSAEKTAQGHTEHREARQTNADEPRTQAPRAASGDGIEVGDRVIARFTDDNKQLSFELTADREDAVNGFVAITSPLGSKVVGCHEEDEVEFAGPAGPRTLLIIRIEREAPAVASANNQTLH